MARQAIRRAAGAYGRAVDAAGRVHALAVDKTRVTRLVWRAPDVCFHMDETTVAARVAEYLARIADRQVASALSVYLIPPQSCLLDWDYSHRHPEFAEPRYPGFVVAAFPQSGTGIAYSDYGFGPRRPWGLIWTARPEYGVTSGWFKTLEEAFRDSVAWNPAVAAT